MGINKNKQEIVEERTIFFSYSFLCVLQFQLTSAGEATPLPVSLYVGKLASNHISMVLKLFHKQVSI